MKPIETENDCKETMKTKIKICGLKSLSDIEVVNELKPEFIGFVFWPKSKRYITKEEAAVLKEKLNTKIKAVGVFLDAKAEEIAEIANAGIIDYIQLHGHEDNAFIEDLRKMTDKTVIQAVILESNSKEEGSLKETQNGTSQNGQPYKDSANQRIKVSTADYILVDSGAGSGKLIDPENLAKVEGEYFLAGGLSPENIEEIIEKYHPFAVDVSSGVETDGRKDPSKMKDFVEKVRRMQ